jgi:hypothetical protein
MRVSIRRLSCRSTIRKLWVRASRLQLVRCDLLGEITGKGVQVGLRTIIGLGYGLTMSRLYAKRGFPPLYLRPVLILTS